MKQYQVSLIQLNAGDQLFSPVSNLSIHNLQQLSQAITQLSQIYIRSFFRIYSIKPQLKPPWVIGKFNKFYFMIFVCYVIFRGWDKWNLLSINCNALSLRNAKANNFKVILSNPPECLSIYEILSAFFTPLFFVIDKIIRNYQKSKLYFEQSNIMLAVLVNHWKVYLIQRRLLWEQKCILKSYFLFVWLFIFYCQ